MSPSDNGDNDSSSNPSPSPSPSAPVPPSTLAHFHSIPWCAKHLADPAFRPVHLSRTLTHNGTGHTLMAATWNTPDTIAQILSIYRPPPPLPPPPPPSAPPPLSNENGSGTNVSGQGEIRRFYTFGAGLNAHPSLLHGGVIATILDSTMGNIVGLDLGLPGGTVRNSPYAGEKVAFTMFTKNLNVEYVKPVRTPGTVMVRAWIVRIDDGEDVGERDGMRGRRSRRKVHVHAVVEGNDGDEKMVVHAKGDGLWVSAKTKRKKENL